MQITKTGKIINNFHCIGDLNGNDCYKFETYIKKQIKHKYKDEFTKLNRRGVFDTHIYKDVVSKYTKGKYKISRFYPLFEEFFIKNQSKEYYSIELLLAKLEEYVFQEIKIEKLIADAINIKLKLPTIKK